MGYNYYLLIQGEKDGQVQELDYKSSSGSYGSCTDHYFFERMNREYDYQGTKEMGEYQYIHPFEILKMMYDKFNVKDPEEIRKKITELISGELNREILIEIREYIDAQLDTDSLTEGAFNELEIYYQKCVKFMEKGYTDLKVIFGHIP